VDFGLLGPLTVRHDGARVDISATMQRAVLAALLLRPNRVVPLSTLVDELWGLQPPSVAGPLVGGVLLTAGTGTGWSFVVFAAASAVGALVVLAIPRT
jgi:hypothetical protein